jgi:hypothetical protein
MLASPSVRGQRAIVEEIGIPHITAILYLEDGEASNSWEFKLIGVANQKTPAVIFNLRRLFSTSAESYFTLHFDSNNAIAVQSSTVSDLVFQPLLRLSLYLEGAEGGNVTIAKMELNSKDESGNLEQVTAVEDSAAAEGTRL